MECLFNPENTKEKNIPLITESLRELRLPCLSGI